jgi:hypothetical protein
LGFTLAGIKAGALAWVTYVGGNAIANVAVLYAFKPDILSSLSQLASRASAASINSTVVEAPPYCLNTIVAVAIPIEALLAFFVSLIRTPGRRSSQTVTIRHSGSRWRNLLPKDATSSEGVHRRQ